MSTGTALAAPGSSTPVVFGPAAAVAGELVDRAVGEFPAVAELGERERLLVAAWLSSLRSARTRRGYLQDVRGWLDWLSHRQVDVLAATRVHVDLWTGALADGGAEASTIRRRLSGLSSLYRYLARHDLVGGNPAVGVERPVVDADHTATVAITREEARALIAAADADAGPQAARTRLVVRLLIHNALRVDETCSADLADLTVDRGHRVLRFVGKGGRKAKAALTPSTQEALEAYLADRAAQAGITVGELGGPLLATRTGGRMTQAHLWELVRRLAKTAGIAAWAQLSPHSMRHSAITFALDAGTPLRDAQDYARHRDPRTTRRYDHSRASLDRSPAYTVAAWLG